MIFSAVIFDLDGVITKTAEVHSHAWKKMFDGFLQTRSGANFQAFTQNDYLQYVDGKPRYDGVKSFLSSRGIELPFGDPSDKPELETVCALGNRKNLAFNQVLEKEGVEVFPSTVRWMKWLRENGIRVGVASSSKNCYAVLKAAGLLDLIETRVDGEVAAELHLKGKPEPDIFLTAAENLGVKPHQTIIVEDATSGVAAGRKGNFGLVIGLARENNEQELLANGADLVVSDLEELDLTEIEDWFETGIRNDGWEISYHSYEPQKERTRETLLTVGNGYFGTRGCFDGMDANTVNYPGTYVAGLYNRLTTPIAGKDIENEDFVNIPNWLPFTFKIGEGDWLTVSNATIDRIKRTLNFQNGLYTCHLELTDPQGNQTLLVSQRFASMAQPHLAAATYSIVPLNYSGKITVKAGLNGDLINEGVERYKSLNQKHLQPLSEGAEGSRQFVLVQTTQSQLEIAQVADYQFFENDKQDCIHFEHTSKPGVVSGEYTFEAKENEIYTIKKKVAIFTSKPDDSPQPLVDAIELIDQTPSFEELLEESHQAWEKIWDRIDLEISGDRSAQRLIRLHLYHLMASMSPNNGVLDASITARGLHGEAYRGHIFWDELFIQPLYNLHLPEITKAMLMYRYRRLDAARAYARQYGFKGAMFPWQSGSDGREETQIIHLNPLSGKWDDDHSSLQRHVSLAIAYNVWQYFHTTGDIEFIRNYGLELFLEICRFWASKCEWNPETKRYSIDKVMGPDEFHEAYPNASQGGLRDNGYTNLMASWMFERVPDLLKAVGVETEKDVRGKINLSEAETAAWDQISGNLNLCINADGIIAQYDGYFELKDLDWNFYKEKYGNIYRMDRILKSENKSPDEFKVAKQADLLMTFYNLDKEEVDRILQKLGYPLPGDYLQRNLDYYLQRTSHGSTLSRVVHGKLAMVAGNPALSWQLYSDALSSDFNDIQGGTTGEGIHSGVMAGTVLIALNTYAGINWNGNRLKINPQLPSGWECMKFSIRFKGITYRILIDQGHLEISADTAAEVEILGKKHSVSQNTLQVALRGAN